MTWKLDDALALVRRLELALSPHGFHVGMTGSVLTKSQSDNDLDLILFPHSTAYVNMAEVRRTLLDAGLKPSYSRAAVAAAWEKRGSFDAKHVERWVLTHAGSSTRYVDFFFLR